ncbi:hypothetical protein [Pseudomonas siliginis]|uniref:hypothetical protein n=1 Tax=Pseudomonas siliginis TaxID=2842346 RepID=UPI002093C899|nr:hypothetical protein [Pseudomonas siliginis]UST77160.1 hypothetical protein NF676_00400 [Pseudomonas siliginis]
MNLFWYLIRPLYAVALIPAALLFVVVMANASKDPEITLVVSIVGLVLAALAVLIFSVIPRAFKTRLHRIVNEAAPGMRCDFEATSSLLNRYVGFDRSAKKLVYVDISDGTRAVLDFPDVNAWHVETVPGKPALLNLMTSVAELPLIGVPFDRRYSNELMAKLTASFG